MAKKTEKCVIEKIGNLNVSDCYVGTDKEYSFDAFIRCGEVTEWITITCNSRYATPRAYSNYIRVTEPEELKTAMVIGQFINKLWDKHKFTRNFDALHTYVIDAFIETYKPDGTMKYDVCPRERVTELREFEQQRKVERLRKELDSLAS